ncbi:basic helix-loop-helix protein [Ranunculus cassubicifolius]
MEFFNQQNQFGSSNAPESPDSGGSSRYRSNSDEESEVVLASNRPKRSAGRKKFRETRHPVYRGVRKRNNNKWVCEVREPNKKSRIWLGTFDTAEMAARAHDVAALALRGRSTCLNFADSVWRLPIPESTDPHDIRKAATEAAELFRDSLPSPSSSSERVRAENVTTTTPPRNENENENQNMYYIDDSDFGMQGMLASMAEGLLLSPPPSLGNDHYNWGEDVEDNSQMSLWSF